MNIAWLSFSTLAHEVILINSVYHEEKQDKAIGKVSKKKKKKGISTTSLLSKRTFCDDGNVYPDCPICKPLAIYGY